MPLRIGDPAPDFEMMNQDKTPVKLSEFPRTEESRPALLSHGFQPHLHDGALRLRPGTRQDQRRRRCHRLRRQLRQPVLPRCFQKQYNIPYDLLADINRKMVKA